MTTGTILRRFPFYPYQITYSGVAPVLSLPVGTREIVESGGRLQQMFRVFAGIAAGGKKDCVAILA